MPAARNIKSPLQADVTYFAHALTPQEIEGFGVGQLVQERSHHVMVGVSLADLARDVNELLG